MIDASHAATSFKVNHRGPILHRGARHAVALCTRQTIRFAYSSRFRPGHPATRKAATRFTAGISYISSPPLQRTTYIKTTVGRPLTSSEPTRSYQSTSVKPLPIPCSLVLSLGIGLGSSAAVQTADQETKTRHGRRRREAGA